MTTPTPCSSTTRAGQPCRFSARKETGLCINHDPAYRETQRQNRESGARNSVAARAKRSEILGLDEFHLATGASVQVFLDTIVRLELAGRFPPGRLRNLIRVGSLAVRNLPERHTKSSHERDDGFVSYAHLRNAIDARLSNIYQDAIDQAVASPSSKPGP